MQPFYKAINVNINKDKFVIVEINYCPFYSE